jgi:hypothetical protein
MRLTLSEIVLVFVLYVVVGTMLYTSCAHLILASFWPSEYDYLSGFLGWTGTGNLDVVTELLFLMHDHVGPGRTFAARAVLGLPIMLFVSCRSVRKEFARRLYQRGSLACTVELISSLLVLCGVPLLALSVLPPDDASKRLFAVLLFPGIIWTSVR